MRVEESGMEGEGRLEDWIERRGAGSRVELCGEGVDGWW